MAAKSVVSFRVGQQWYGIAIESVTEILHLVMLTEAPVSNPDVIGLLQLRNTIMPVVDLRLRFGHSNPDYRLDTPVIAAQTPMGPIAYVVDDVDNVEQLTGEDIVMKLAEDIPYVASAAKVGDKLLLVMPA
jgi:purine-binding chemotaxis protein CheW